MRRIHPIETIVFLLAFTYVLFPSYLGTRIGGVLFGAQRAMMLALIVLLVVDAAINRRSIPRLIRVVGRSSVTALLVTVYLAARVASAWQSENVARSLNTAVSDVLSLMLFLYVGIYIARDLQRINKAITMLVGMAGILCVIGVIEMALGHNVIMSAFPMLSISDDDYLQFALSAKMRGTYRVESTFYHPLEFASYLVLMLPFAVYCLQRARTRAAKCLYLAIIALMAANAFATGSRASILLIAFVAIFYSIRFIRVQLKSRHYPKRVLAGVSLCVLVLLLALAPPVAKQLVVGKGEDQQSSSAGRLVQIANGAEVVADHPLLGVGPRMAGQYIGLSDGTGVPTVDNWYLTLVVESGVLALTCFIGSLATTVWRCRQLMAAHGESEPGTNLLRAISLAILVFSLFMVILSLYQTTLPYLFLIMGVVMSMNDLALSGMRVRATKGAMLLRLVASESLRLMKR